MFGAGEGEEGGFEGFEGGFDGGGGDGEGGGGRAGFEGDFLAGEEGDVEGEGGGGGEGGGELGAQLFERQAEARVAEEDAVVGCGAGAQFLLSVGGGEAGAFDVAAHADAFG